jgi:hypothetical protein
MTKFRVLLASLFVLLLFAAIPCQTKAYDGFCGGYNWDIRGFGSSGNLYGLGYIPTPPYFAIHPPVYYGQRYFRTYGESPFARPARAARPLNVSVQLIKNPFVESLPSVLPEAPPVIEQETQKDQVAVKPVAQLIVNPYYRAEDEVVQK